MEVVNAGQDVSPLIVGGREGPRSGAAEEALACATPSALLVGREESKDVQTEEGHDIPEGEGSEEKDAAAELPEQSDALAFSAHKDLLLVPTRRELPISPTLYIYGSRTTTVDVMSTTNTTKVCDANLQKSLPLGALRNGERRRIQCHLPYAQIYDSDNAIHAQVNPAALTGVAARRALVSRHKRNKELMVEQSNFIERLTQEREDRVQLETFAATLIQANFRGYLGRPRPKRPRQRRVVTKEEENQRLLADLQRALSRASLPTVPGLDLNGKPLSRGLFRRAGNRKKRALEDAAATQITSLVRGYLGRNEARRRWSTRQTNLAGAAACTIARAYRQYENSKRWRSVEDSLRDANAAVIQCRFRGMSTRMRLERRQRLLWFAARRLEAAVKIQAVGRGHSRRQQNAAAVVESEQAAGVEAAAAAVGDTAAAAVVVEPEQAAGAEATAVGDTAAADSEVEGPGAGASLGV